MFPFNNFLHAAVVDGLTDFDHPKSNFSLAVISTDRVSYVGLPKLFTADHPFLFYFGTSGVVWFIGRVV